MKPTPAIRVDRVAQKGSCQESGQLGLELRMFGGAGRAEAMHERADAVGCTHLQPLGEPGHRNRRGTTILVLSPKIIPTKSGSRKTTPTGSPSTPASHCTKPGSSTWWNPMFQVCSPRRSFLRAATCDAWFSTRVPRARISDRTRISATPSWCVRQKSCAPSDLLSLSRVTSTTWLGAKRRTGSSASPECSIHRLAAASMRPTTRIIAA